MPVIERVVGKKDKTGKRSSYKTATHMKNIIKYILEENKTREELMGSRNIINKNNAFNEFVLTKMTYNKMPISKQDTSKRMVVHYVQSFDPKDSKITPELAKKIADEFASSIYFKEYQVVYAVHVDARHIHTHFVVNTTNIVNGKSWQQTKQELEKMKQLSDEIALSYGISIINDRTKERGKHVENAEYQAEKRGVGWKKEVFHICKEAKEASSSMEEFIKLLNENGVNVRLSESRRDITYIFNDKKINSDKLGFPKRGFTPFTKEELAKFFARKISKETANKTNQDIMGNNEKKRVKDTEKLNDNRQYLYALSNIEKLLEKDEVKNDSSPVEHSKGSMAKMFYKEESKKTKGIER